MGWFNGIPRTPTLLQMETSECGAVCLGIILAHYGRHLPLEVLRRECGVGRDGSKASNILRAARHFHLESNGIRASIDDLAKMKFPAIIHWENQHFVVLEGFGRKGRAYVNDPAFGHRVLDREQFRKAYAGVAIALSPEKNFRKGGRRFSVVRALAGKLITEKAALIFMLAVSLLLVVPGLAEPIFSQVLFDDILSGARTDWFRPLIFFMGLICFIRLILTAIGASVLTRWRSKLTLKDSAAFFWHVLRLPSAFFQQRFSGEIAMRVQFNESVAGIITGKALLKEG